MLDESFREFVKWLSTTPLADFMHGQWEWPIAESLHFIGLSLLMGTVGPSATPSRIGEADCLIFDCWDSQNRFPFPHCID